MAQLTSFLFCLSIQRFFITRLSLLQVEFIKTREISPTFKAETVGVDFSFVLLSFMIRDLKIWEGERITQNS